MNDPPAGTDTTVTTDEDTPYVFATADFGFTDPLDGNALAAVRITTSPGTGSLTNNNVAVAPGTFVSLTDIAAGHLRFTPAPDANGSPYVSFTFQVQDNGGILNGGVDLDPSANTITVNVNPVNDPPGGNTGGAGTVNYTEQAAAVVLDNTLVVTDPDDTDLEGATLTIAAGFEAGDALHFTNQLGITGSYNAGTHELTLTGTATLLNYQTALRSITFDNATNDNPTSGPARSITWEVDDGTGLTNILTTTINFTAVNDAPVNHVPGTQSFQSNIDHAIAGLSVSDADAGGALNLTTTLSVAHGTLTVASAGGAAVGGSGTGTVTLTGSLTQINTTLAAASNVVFHSTDGLDDTLTVLTNDHGNSSTAPLNPLSDTDTVTIDLTHQLPLLPQGAGHYDADHSGAACCAATTACF